MLLRKLRQIMNNYSPMEVSSSMKEDDNNSSMDPVDDKKESEEEEVSVDSSSEDEKSSGVNLKKYITRNDPNSEKTPGQWVLQN